MTIAAESETRQKMSQKVAIRYSGHDLPGVFAIRQPASFGRFHQWPGAYRTIAEAIATIQACGSQNADVVDTATDEIVWPSRVRSRKMTAGKDGRP